MKASFKVSLIIGLFFIALALMPKFSSVLASKLTISPESDSVEQGEDLEVKIILNGENEVIDGVDAVVSYDPDYLLLKETEEGPFFGSYPVKEDTSGRVKITALANKDGVPVHGDVEVATLKFEILDSGETKLDFEFEEGSTKDSNVPVHGTANDSLTEVSGGTYEVTATLENLERARAKKAAGRPSPLLVFIPLLILIAFAFWYWWRKRKPKEDVYTPEPFPMDRPPDSQ